MSRWALAPREGLVDESELGILGDVDARDVLEIGCGAAQCARWLSTRGARAVGLDLSFRQLQHARRLDVEHDLGVPVVCGTATHLPFRDASFHVAFSSFGALQFVEDVERTVAEVARVLRPGGRFAFSVPHPVRWAMPDDPTREGLVVTSSYWDRTPYVEEDAGTGEPRYVEHHRTLGDWVALLAGHGFRITDLVEPEWPAGHDRLRNAALVGHPRQCRFRAHAMHSVPDLRRQRLFEELDPQRQEFLGVLDRLVRRPGTVGVDAQDGIGVLA